MNLEDKAVRALENTYAQNGPAASMLGAWLYLGLKAIADAIRESK